MSRKRMPPPDDCTGDLFSTLASEQADLGEPDRTWATEPQRFLPSHEQAQPSLFDVAAGHSAQPLRQVNLLTDHQMAQGNARDASDLKAHQEASFSSRREDLAEIEPAMDWAGDSELLPLPELSPMWERDWPDQDAVQLQAPDWCSEADAVNQAAMAAADENRLAGLGDDWPDFPPTDAWPATDEFSAGAATAPFDASQPGHDAAEVKEQEQEQLLNPWANLPAADLDAPDALERLKSHLKAWKAHEQLRPLDLALANFLLSLDSQMPPLALLGAVLASHQLGRGHVCLNLHQLLKYGLRVLGWRRVALAGAVPLVPTAQVAQGRAASAAPSQDGSPASQARGEAAAVEEKPVVEAAQVDPADGGASSSAESALTLLPTPLDWLQNVRVEDWQRQLQGTPLVQNGPGAAPMVLSGPRLYLRRQWEDEQVVRKAILVRGSAAGSMRGLLPEAQWADALHALFPADEAKTESEMDWQKAACALAASQGFCIITGGPGTGKTTTVVKLLALLQGVSLAQGDGRTLRIELAAPTGKAAARLGDSIRDAMGRLRLDKLVATLNLHTSIGNAKSSSAGNADQSDGAKVDAVAVLRQAIPTQARTLHRLLGAQPNSRHFRHNARNPLPLDVLVVDEASMVDLDMMARLLQALPPHARLVLLGDKDQLASVEAGAVLGELCSRAQHGHYLPDTAAWMQRVTGQAVPDALQDAHGTPLDQAVVMLRRSHRFDGQSGIGRLAAAVNAGDVNGVTRLRSSLLPDLSWLQVDDTRAPAFASLVRDGGDWSHAQVRQGDALAQPAALYTAQGHAHYLQVMAQGEAQWREAREAALRQVGALAQPPSIDEAALAHWALAALEAQRQFQLLCALREGPWGVKGLNRRITRVLADAGLIQPRGEWWAGRPVMMTGNDYGLGLMNGDVGVTLQRPDRLAVAFPAVDRPGGVRWVAPSRLNRVETVFAMTVHKSQGSEFTHTAVLVPPNWSPVLTRELLYTGVTRARRWCSLVLAGEQSDQVLALAVRRRVLRASGLLSEA